MYKQAPRFFAGLLLGIAPLWAAAGISNYPCAPGFGVPTYSQDELNQAYGKGKLVGRQESASECILKPEMCGCIDGIKPCGISLSSVLSGAQFGETEPNDHPVAADGLIPEVLFWGQTPWLKDKLGDWHTDEDWYYLTTNEVNQRMTINFTVPDRVLADTSRLSQGWMVTVRDAAANVYAQFDTRFVLDDLSTPNKNESKEIAFPVFLGHTGTYYISVEPRVDDGSGSLVTDPSTVNLDALSVTFQPYTLAVVLDYSGLDDVPQDVNFHDVEIEPNNSNKTANALTSGVTMFGLLRQASTDVKKDGATFKQTDVDVFKYTSAGHEQVALAWCGREECKAWCGTDLCTDEIFWFVEVTDANNTPLISFNTNMAETVHFGLNDPGEYFVTIDFERTTSAFCSQFSENEFECQLESAPACQELVTTANPGDPLNNIDPYMECRYAPGNSCKDSAESPDTLSCARTDNNDNLFLEGCSGDGSDPADTECDGTCECVSGTATCIGGNDPAATACPSDIPSLPLGDDVVFTDNTLWKWESTCEAFGPVCLTYSPIKKMGALNVEYNFTFWGNKLPPLTYGTEAFDNFLKRIPRWYGDIH